DPRHLDRPDGQAQYAEQREVDDHHQRDAKHRMARIDVALQPVVRSAVTKSGHGFGILGLYAIQLGADEHDAIDTEDHRRMGIALAFAARMMFAMNGHPLFGDHAGADPQPEPEKMGRDGMQIEPAMRLAAVQEDRDADDGDMRGNERVEHD